MSIASNKSPLRLTAETGPTEVWNDSCSLAELAYALENGAVGATTNPVIVAGVLKKEMPLWRGRILELAAALPTASEETIAWKIIEEMAVKGADLLKPVFDKHKGLKGRISIQTNAKLYRDAAAMVEQAVYFDTLAPNMQVKIPVSTAGIPAIEEATRRGVSVNATVCFSVPQSLAVAEAVERGLARRKKEGRDCSAMSPVCTIMVGRLDDWLKKIAEKKEIITDPGCLEWAGVAAMKKAYGLYKARGFRTRLLAAAYRNHMHWSQFIGADMILTIPYEWQKRFNASDVEVMSRIDDPVDPSILAELKRKFPEFRRAYEENGMSVAEFDNFGANRRTLRSFIAGYHELLSMIRDLMIPDPDLKGE